MQGKSRPDFLGLDGNDRWLVFESKGRSDWVTGQAMASLMGKAKTQASLLIAVNGEAPLATFGAVTHFMDDGVLRFDMDDPPADGRNERAYYVNVSPNALRADYYKIFADRRNSEIIVVRGRRVRVANTGELEVEVGAEEDLLALAQTANRIQIPEWEHDNEFMGRDGVYIRLGTTWSTENMRRPPA